MAINGGPAGTKKTAPIGPRDFLRTEINLRCGFCRVSLCKGVQVPIGVPGRGIWGRAQVGEWGLVLWGNEGKGGCASVFQSYLLANYPLVSACKGRLRVMLA